MKLKEIDLHLTNKCTLRCRHCVFSSGQRVLPEMSYKKISKLIHEFSVMTGGAGTINLFGGEALVRKDIFAIIQEAKSRGLSVGITTNCHVPIHLTEQLLEQRIDRITSDLDGAKPQTHDWLRNMTGNFDEILQMLKKSVAKNIFTTVNSVLFKNNINQTTLILELCQSIGIDVLAFYYLTPTGRGKEIFNQILGPKQWLETKKIVTEWIEKNSPPFSVCWEEAYEPVRGGKKNPWRCEAQHTDTIFVRCDGEVYSCALLEGSSCSLGNVNQDKLKTILTKRAKLAFPHSRRCPALAFHKNGNIYGADPRPALKLIQLGCPYNYLMLYEKKRKQNTTESFNQ